MSEYYFVDTENTGDKWIDLLDDANGIFIVFHTTNSPHIACDKAIKLRKSDSKIQFIECHTGNNALDFQLVTVLGYVIRSKKTEEFIIVSNDTGFDAVIDFWKEHGVNISRFSYTVAPKQPSKSKKKSTDTESTATGSSSQNEAEKIHGVDSKEIYTVINCIGAENAEHIHNAFIHFYGSLDGRKIYSYMKQTEFSVPPVDWTNKTKLTKLINLIIKHSDVEFPDSFSGFIANNVVDDKKIMLQKINGAFSGNGPQFNKVFSTFYEILAKIKN